MNNNADPFYDDVFTALNQYDLSVTRDLFAMLTYRLLEHNQSVEDVMNIVTLAAQARDQHQNNPRNRH
jgi:hypothetical protein